MNPLLSSTDNSSAVRSPVDPGQHARARLPDWAREPLLHFMLLGAALFAIDHVLVGDSEDPHLITIGPAVEQEARQLFKSSRGREANAEELAALRQVWLDNEVLYREGLALQVDRGDPTIRERVIFKALSVVEVGLKRPAVDEKLLREWFERNRARYDEPARFDFQEAVLTGESSEAAAHSFAQQLNQGNPGDAKAGLRVFKGRPQQNLVQSYGETFAKALEQLPTGEWRSLQGRDGWRVIRLEAITAPRPASFEALRGVLLQDWTDATMAEQRTAAVRAMARRYTVKTTP